MNFRPVSRYDAPSSYRFTERKQYPFITFSECAKFFNSVVIRGIIADPNCVLSAVRSSDARLLGAVTSNEVNATEGPSFQFTAQLLLNQNHFPHDLSLQFEFSGFDTVVTSLGKIAESIKYPIGRLDAQFRALIEDSSVHRLVDIGGRARSGIIHSASFRDKEVLVLDILPAPEVDIVGDAHRMSEFIEHGSVDAVYSTSVFEHLVMPWKVAIEMNRIMRIGAVGLIVTHQTVGMHDLPWDFFRFSDTAWKGMFNPKTGFEILGTELSALQHVVPAVYSDRYVDVEKTGGFEYSAVLFRKTSDTSIDWPLSAQDVTSDIYPE